MDKFAFKLNGGIGAATYLADGKSVPVERTASGDAVVTICRPKDCKYDIVVKMAVN